MASKVGGKAPEHNHGVETCVPQVLLGLDLLGNPPAGLASRDFGVTLTSGPGGTRGTLLGTGFPTLDGRPCHFRGETGQMSTAKPVGNNRAH